MMNDEIWRVPRCWSGEIVVILGGGHSLTQEQVDYCRGKARVIAINKAYLLAPWADMLWMPDPAWAWAWTSGSDQLNKAEPDALAFAGIKVVLSSPAHPPNFEERIGALVEAGVKVMRHRGEDWHTGVELENGYVRGNNSCFHLLSSVIPHTGAKRVILLGIDMTPGRFHANWPMGEPEYECRTKERCYRSTWRWKGRIIELGWYQKPAWAYKTWHLYEAHIAAGCPQPAPELYGMIPRYATLVGPLEELGIEVFNATPGSALKTFPMVRLEKAL
jgi:hypothetical protein